MRRQMVALACVLLALTLACNRGAPAGDEPTDGPTAAASPTPEPTPCVLEGASTDPQRLPENPQDPETAREFSPVTDVRHNDDEGCPRIVFEFQDPVPGYSISYEDPPFKEDGSGREIDHEPWDAGAYLVVRLEPSASVDTMNDYEETYTGPRDIEIEGDVLKHMRVAGDYEAVFEWVIALDEERPFTVKTFDDPARLVIDVSQG